MNLIDADLMNSGTCLYNSKPIPLNPELALLLGDSDMAIILQQIHYWIMINKEMMEFGKASVDTFKEGRVWVFHTYEEWEEQFIWLSLITIKRKIAKLEDMGLLISGDYNVMKVDRTKWYTINYLKLSELSKQAQTLRKDRANKISERKAKQKQYNQKQNSSQKAKYQVETMAKYQVETMAKYQVDTTNNKRLTIQDNTIQEINSNGDVIQSVSQSKKEKEETYRLTEHDMASLQFVLSNTEIHDLKTIYKQHIAIIDEIEFNIMDMLTSSYVTIKGDNKPKEIIKSVLFKLTFSHLEYVMFKFIDNKSKVTNNKAYLQTMIYNSLFEMNASIINDVKSKLGY